MTETAALTAVRTAGRKYARAQAARTAALEALQAALREADAEGGHTRLALVEAAGVSKQTVYDALQGRAANPEAARLARLAERRERLAAELAEVDQQVASVGAPA